LGTTESEEQTDPILPRKIRWLAVAAGCFSALAWSLGGLYFAIVSGPLIVGAIVQPRFRRLGTALVAAGALYLSFWVLPYGIGILFGTVRTLRQYHDLIRLGVTSLWVVSILLVGWCDAALVIDAVKRRRARRKT
jgi:hypothetical protein